MTDSANLPPESALPTDATFEAIDDTVPGFQPPAKSRYRPSEAWALRWLGSPSG